MTEKELNIKRFAKDPDSLKPLEISMTSSYRCQNLKSG